MEESGKASEEKAPENTDAKEENSDDAEELKVSDAQGSGLLSVLDWELTDEEEYRRARPGAAQARGGEGVRRRGDLGERARDLHHRAVPQRRI